MALYVILSPEVWEKKKFLPKPNQPYPSPPPPFKSQMVGPLWVAVTENT